MQERMEESRQQGYAVEDIKQMRAREQELLAYRKHIVLQEHALDESRLKLKQEQLAREKQIQKDLEARETFFADRERKLFERQKDVEQQLLMRQQESEHLRMRLEVEITKREAELSEAMKQLELEKARYTEESRKKSRASLKTTSQQLLTT